MARHGITLQRSACLRKSTRKPLWPLRNPQNTNARAGTPGTTIPRSAIACQVCGLRLLCFRLSSSGPIHDPSPIAGGCPRGQLLRSSYRPAPHGGAEARQGCAHGGEQNGTRLFSSCCLPAMTANLNSSPSCVWQAVSAVVGYLMGLAAKELKDSHLLYSRTGELLKAIAGLGDSNPKFWRAFARFVAPASTFVGSRDPGRAGHSPFPPSVGHAVFPSLCHSAVVV